MAEQENKKDIVVFESKDGEAYLEVTTDYDTVWLTQQQIAQLFDKTVPTINEHIKNIYKEEELEEGATIRKFRIVQMEGGRNVEREVNHYNLDVIIKVGQLSVVGCVGQPCVWQPASCNNGQRTTGNGQRPVWPMLDR